MAFAIVNSAGSTVLTATTGFSLATGNYYFHRCKVDSCKRKVTIDSTPGAGGSFAQDFGNMWWTISGGSLLICNTTEAACKSTFEAFAVLIKEQIGLTLTIPNENGTSGGTYPNCVCTAFEIIRFPDGRIVKPNGNGATFRCVVQMEFVQLSQ